MRRNSAMAALLLMAVAMAGCARDAEPGADRAAPALLEPRPALTEP